MTTEARRRDVGPPSQHDIRATHALWNDLCMSGGSNVDAAGSSAVGTPSPDPREKPGAVGPLLRAGLRFLQEIRLRWFGVVADSSCCG
jgi:hypothetical protein